MRHANAVKLKKRNVTTGLLPTVKATQSTGLFPTGDTTDQGNTIEVLINC
jgi:hypothetical protein